MHLWWKLNTISPNSKIWNSVQSYSVVDHVWLSWRENKIFFALSNVMYRLPWTSDSNCVRQSSADLHKYCDRKRSYTQRRLRMHLIRDSNYLIRITSGRWQPKVCLHCNMNKHTDTNTIIMCIFILVFYISWIEVVVLFNQCSNKFQAIA